MPMRELPVSSEENDFILGALTKNIRLDKRDMLSYRELSINFGCDLGYCMVSLGDTKVSSLFTKERKVYKYLMHLKKTINFNKDIFLRN